MFFDIREQEDEIFESWSKKRTNNFAKDGAGSSFMEQPVKIIFIGKETNNTNQYYDIREYLDNGMVFKSTTKRPNGRIEHKKGAPMGYNLYRWAKALMNDTISKIEYSKNEKDKTKRQMIFDKVAFMNIKKESGGSSSSTNNIIKTGKEDKEYLQQQLNLYINNNDIKVLFLCGDGIYTPIKDIIRSEYKLIDNKELLIDKNPNGKHPYDRFIEGYSNNLFIIKFYHFKASVSHETTYKMILKIKEYMGRNL